MNIALLTDGIHPYVVGGMQKHSFYLAKYLAAAGHRVDLYHTNQSQYDIHALEFFTEAEKNNIRSFVVSFPQQGKLPGHYLRESYEYSKKVYSSYTKNSRPDFIYIKGFAGWELLNRKSKGEKFPPVGVNFHGYEMFQRQPSLFSSLQARFLLRAPVRFHAEQADFLFSYGGRITEIIESLGVPRKRIIEIPTGIGEEWLNDSPAPSGKVRRFVFVGRYERRKGIPELTAVLSKLKEKRDDEFEMHFIGPIPDSKKIRAKNFIYHGNVSDPAKMKELLRAMEVLVCPSFSEGMPNVIMEALASGLAVVATDVGAVPVMVTPQTGWLIAPGDTAALAIALEKAIDAAPGDLDALRRNAVAHVRANFLWDRVCAMTVEAIRERL